MNIESLITDLAFILLLGAVVTLLFKWIKQPVVLGYIVAGFLASPHFEWLPSVTTEANIDFWAQLGIVVLLFSLGVEFSFKKLVNTGASAVVTALIIVCGMMLAGFCVGHMLHYNTINCLFLGGMLSMSSTTIIIKAFTDLGLRQKKFASMVFAVLIVEDLFAVLMMVILSSIATSNGVEGKELVYSVAKLVFFLVIWFLVGIYMLPSFLNKCRRFLNDETLLIVSMGLCLGMAVFSVYCGFSLALGAFVMGSILASTSFSERIEHVVTPVKDLFGAVFFISVGMMVQPAVVAQYWQIILLLSLVVIVGMILFGTLGMLLTGQTLQVAIQSGFSLTQIGEFAFIIATLGMSLGVLDATIYPIVVAVSVLTTFTTPYFIKLSGPAYRFAEKHLPPKFRFLINRYHDQASTSEAHRSAWRDTIRRMSLRLMIYTIILIAIVLCARLYLYEIIDAHFPKYADTATMWITLAAMAPFLVALLMPITRLLSGGREARKTGDGAEPKLNFAVIVMSLVCFIVANLFIVNVITGYSSMRWGLSFALAVVLLVVLMLSRRMRRSMTGMETRFLDNLNERELRRNGRRSRMVNDLHLAYMTVGTGCKFAGERLKDSNVRSRYGVNIVSIQRGTVTFTVPGGERRIFPGDVLGVIGTDEQIERLLPLVECDMPVDPTDEQPQDFRLIRLMLSADSPLVGKTPVTSGLRDNYDALVLAVLRGDDYIDSEPNLRFLAGDILYLVGNPARLDALK